MPTIILRGSIAAGDFQVTVFGQPNEPSFEPRAVFVQILLNCCTPLWPPGHIFEPTDQSDREFRFRHVSSRFILVRKSQLNPPDKVRQVHPTLDFLAQPTKPTPGNFAQRIVGSDRTPRVYQWTTPTRMTNFNKQLELPRVVPEPPNGSKKIMRTLESSVIESIDIAPVRMISVGEQSTRTECENIARPDDDAQSNAIHVALLQRRLSVVITVKVDTYQHGEFLGLGRVNTTAAHRL